MHVAVMGGSFNPPHVAHILAAAWVLSARKVDEVWFVPVASHAFGKVLEPFEDRMRMMELACAPIGSRCRVSDVEHRLGGTSRTIDTLRHLREAHPELSFSLIIGADILAEKHAWKSWDELENDFGFHILGREGHQMPEGYGAKVVLPNVSSTQLRELLGKGEAEACRGLIDLDVLDYILERGLYGVNKR